MISPVVLFGSEIWPLRKTEQMRLEVFEKKVLKIIFGPCKNDRTGKWKKRHNRELQTLFQRPNITKKNLSRMACIEKMGINNKDRNLAGKRLLERITLLKRIMLLKA